MKRFIALLLAVVLSVVGCTKSPAETETIDKDIQTEEVSREDVTSTELQSNNPEKPKIEASKEIGSTEEGFQEEEIEDREVQFDSLDDPLLLQYVEDSVYTGLTD